MAVIATDPPPPLSPGTYLRKRREAAGLELEDLALMLDSSPAVSARARAELLAAVERDAHPVTEDLLRALLGAGIAYDEHGQLHRVAAFPFDPVVLIKLMDAYAWIQPAGCTALNPTGTPPRLCVRCACSDHDRCRIPSPIPSPISGVMPGDPAATCHWVGDRLCSACADADPTPAGKGDIR